jgi:hypothetical protein
MDEKTQLNAIENKPRSDLDQDHPKPDTNNDQSKSDSNKDNSQSKPNNRKKRSSAIDVAIWVAIITALSAIIVELINHGSFDNLFHQSIPSPTISISSDVRDISDNPIAMNSAPFQVSVQGTVSDTVSNTNGLYVYLIVVNKYHQYVQPVQPGVGSNVGNKFSNLCQLGEKDNPDAYGQKYTIYAVVTDKLYTDFAFFEGQGYIAKSKELIITREPLPTPTTTP